jgi:hypothetical protein
VSWRAMPPSDFPIPLNHPLTHYRVEQWWRSDIDVDDRRSELFGYFRSEEEALEMGRGKGWYGSNGSARAVYVLTADGKTGWELSVGVSAVLVKDAEDAILQKALGKLSDAERSVIVKKLGSDHGKR